MYRKHLSNPPGQQNSKEKTIKTKRPKRKLSNNLLVTPLYFNVNTHVLKIPLPLNQEVKRSIEEQWKNYPPPTFSLLLCCWEVNVKGNTKLSYFTGSAEESRVSWLPLWVKVSLPLPPCVSSDWLPVWWSLHLQRSGGRHLVKELLTLYIFLYTDTKSSSFFL